MLVHNEGPNIKVEAIKRLGLPVSPSTVSLQEHRTKEQERDKNRKRKAQTKEIRLKRRELTLADVVALLQVLAVISDVFV